ncbi:hypothetical protein GGTG_13063 [Gaeumannomyces tritici R3-111a-1]|uniref:Uncharacterized protein n=1 Tax=Gaeumannomyces tritici (strain R3-111a-1) TaxID=644352 RepID=J3PHT2_GAET3|nr:hypothetical protein GGTG_13063 [Gaeumannomyces tritici R3-111a-1]EJT69444.1 hypothetical protein GGTG_13063 [Gaeumannomyces tritici R3-111a-1]
MVLVTGLQGPPFPHSAHQPLLCPPLSSPVMSNPPLQSEWTPLAQCHDDIAAVAATMTKNGILSVMEENQGRLGVVIAALRCPLIANIEVEINDSISILGTRLYRSARSCHGLVHFNVCDRLRPPPFPSARTPTLSASSQLGRQRETKIGGARAKE